MQYLSTFLWLIMNIFTGSNIETLFFGEIGHDFLFISVKDYESNLIVNLSTITWMIFLNNLGVIFFE